MCKNEIISNRDSLELSVITPIYRFKNKTILIDGVKTPVEVKVLVKELRTKKWIKKDAITSIEDYVTKKDTIAKDRSVIYDKYTSKFFATCHNTDQLIQAVSPIENKKVGFNK